MFECETKPYSDDKFDMDSWVYNIVCDMSEVKFVRMEIRGTANSFLAFSEEKENYKAKKITYAIDILAGNNRSFPSWIEKGDGHQFYGTGDLPEPTEDIYNGKVH